LVATGVPGGEVLEEAVGHCGNQAEGGRRALPKAAWPTISMTGLQEFKIYAKGEKIKTKNVPKHRTFSGREKTAVRGNSK
jgi:hypothetical protein